MTEAENDKSCRRIQQWGAQHPLFYKDFMKEWRKKEQEKAGAAKETK